MRTFFVIVVSVIVVLCLSAWQPAEIDPNPAQIGSDNSGYIVNKLSGLCLEPVPGDGYYNGNYIQVGECKGYDAQYWELTPSYQLYHPESEKCLDTIGDPGTANGSLLQLYDCQEISVNPHQVWRYSSDGYLRNQRSGRCIDVPGASNKTSGSILQIWDCETKSTSTTDQRWTFQTEGNNSFGANQSGFSGGDYGKSSSQDNPSGSTSNGLTVTSTVKIVNLISNKCIDPVGTNPSQGTKVQLSSCTSSSDMIWELTREGFIRNKKSGKCLDVTGTIGTSSGEELRLWDCEVGMRTDQVWNYNNNYFLTNNLSEKCVDVPGVYGDADGLVLQLWDCEYDKSNNTDQQWVFESIEDEDRIFTDGMSGSVLAQTNCSDSDKDCISDKLEQEIANEFMPFFEYDEQEHNILTKQDPSKFGQGSGVVFLYQVSIVDCSLDPSVDINKQDVVEGEADYKRDLYPFGPNGEYKNPRSILFTVLEIFPYDYLPKQNKAYDFATEKDVFVHYGDVETLKYCIRDDDRDGKYKISFVNFSRHKHSYVIDATAEKEGNNWKFYASEGKHGTYISQLECREAVNNYQSFYWGEDCAADGATGKVIYPFTGSRYNVGEFSEGQKLTFSQLGIEKEFRRTAYAKGYPYFEEFIWNPDYAETGDRSNYFCGGMTVPEYWEDQDVTFFYKDITCPGGLSDRWWLTNDLECLEKDIDRLGSDYKLIDKLIVNKPELCAQACVDDPACAAFTFVPGNGQTKPRCYLKNSTPSPTYYKGVYSGLRINCLDEFGR